MSDPRESQLLHRLRGAIDTTTRPEGWEDIVRRADRLGSVMLGSAVRPARRRARWGAVASGVSLAGFVAVIAVLFVMSRASDTSTPTAAELPRTAHYVTTQREKFTTARGRVEGAINVEHEVDLVNRVARHWGVDWPIEMQPPMIEETIITERYVYEKIPATRVTANNGKHWVRYPNTEPWYEIETIKRLVDPLGTAPVPPTPGNKPLAGNFPGGRESQYYSAVHSVANSTEQLDYWVGPDGRLIRSVSTVPSIIDGSPKTYTTDVLNFNLPVNATEPAADDAIDVPSVDAAHRITQ